MKTKTKDPRPPQSLATTLAIAFFTMSAVILLVSGGYAAYISINFYLHGISDIQEHAGNDASEVVTTFIEDKFVAIEAAAEFANPVTATNEARQTFMESLLGLDPAFQQFAVLDSEGRQLAEISRLSPTLSSQFTLQVKDDAVTHGERYISPVYINDGTSEPLIAVSIPVKNVLGDIQGTLIAEINLKFMWDLVDQLKVGETGYAYVVDNEGRLIAYGDTARVLRGENVQYIPEVQEFLENPTAAEDITPDIVAYTGLTGEKVVGRYIPLGTPEWAVFTEVPYSEAYKPTYRALTIFVLATLVMIFFAQLAGVIVAKRLTVPLIELTGTAARIADGELDLKATMGGTKEIASLAFAFNTMTTQLRESISSLEQRVADRTKALATSAEISRRISTILDRQQLIDEVVESVNSSFGYYHTQMYFYDPTGSTLELSGGTGEAGRTLLKQGHTVLKGVGLVGRAAETNTPVIVPDVSTDPKWLPNPLLPETKSEIAIPISAGDIVIGVLDVQHRVSGGLTKNDEDVLQSIANQIMIAAQNGRLLMEAQKRAEREALISSINQKIQSTTTVETALQVAVREVGRALQARTSVQLAQTGEAQVVRKS